MSYGKHAAKRTAKLGKTSLLALSLALVIALSVGGTIAYILAKSDPVRNTFAPTKVEVEIEEHFNKTSKSNITFSNSSEIPVFVRATLAVYWTDADGAIVAQPDSDHFVTGGLVQDNWTKIGDAYYYGKALSAKGQQGDETTVMLSPIEATIPEGSDYKLNVDVLYEAIQAEPDGVVQDAWGVSISDDTVTVVSGS